MGCRVGKRYLAATTGTQANSSSRYRAIEHHAASPYGEIGAFVAALHEQEGIAAQALELVILTASRTGEVIGARWTEFDIDRGTWTIPGGRMKGGKEHRVPLSAPALSIIESLAKAKVGDFVFLAGSSASRFPTWRCSLCSIAWTESISPCTGSGR